MMSPGASYERFSTLSPAAVAAQPDKLQLTSAEITESLGSHVVAAARLRCLVLPQIDLSASDVMIETAPPEEARRVLLRETLTPHDSGYPDWLGVRSESEERLSQRSEELVDELVASHPCLSVRFGSLRAGGGEQLLRAIRSRLAS
jgi:hypothetical protein